MFETADIEQEIFIPLSPHQVFEIWLDSTEHSRITGLPCDIERQPGGKFVVGEGMIEGVVVEVVPDRRIKQTWRISSYGWPLQHFSTLELELRPERGGTRVNLKQTGVPREALPFIETGWHQYYWSPMRALEPSS